MKKLKLPVLIISLLLQLPIFAQVQVDHAIQLTGSGANARLSGIRSVIDSTDATSAEAVQSGNMIYAVATGNSNNFNITVSPPISSYKAGMVFNFISNQNVTGAATLNVNGLGAVPVTKYVNQSLTGCEITNNQAIMVLYDGSNFQIISSYTVSPPVPVAIAATGVASSQFTANWNAATGASSYVIDVATDSNFVTGFVLNSQNVGNVTSYNVTGLSNNTTYYYRVRSAINSCVTGVNSGTISATTLNIPLDIVSYWKLDESSGNPVDAVGNNTATNLNASFGPGKINNGAVFANGNNNESFSITTTGFPTGRAQRTISLWYYITQSPSNTYQTFFWYGNPTQENGDGVSIYNESGVNAISYYGFGDDLVYNFTSALNTWYFLVVTYDGTNATIYLNGSNVATASKPSWNTSSGTTGDIGSLQNTSDWTYGKIDEVGIWSRVLTASEITTLYNNGNGLQYPF